MSKQLLVQYIHFNRHHNTMLMKHNDAALTKKIDELTAEMETLKTEIEADISKEISDMRTEFETLRAQTGPVVMIQRKEAGNPVDFFDKTFAEYQAGFEAKGEIFSITKRGKP